MSGLENQQLKRKSLVAIHVNPLTFGCLSSYLEWKWCIDFDIYNFFWLKKRTLPASKLEVSGLLVDSGGSAFQKE